MISNTQEIHSSITNTGAVKKFIIPNKIQMLVYFLISVTTIFLVNAKAIWRDLSLSVLLPQNGLHDLVQPGGAVDMAWRSIATSKIPLIVFWAIIGCLIYLFIWFAKSLVTNLQNDFIADMYQHPSAYNRSKFWTNVIGHKILFVVTVLISLIYAYSLFVIMPLLSRQAYQSVKFFDSGLNVLSVMIIIAGMMILFHLFFLLIHMLQNMWKIIYKDL